MFFIKGPGKPGQAWHQDELYIPTRDRSLCAAWIAIDDAMIDNGCLWVIPGSHKSGIIYPNKSHNDPRFDSAGQSYDFEPYKEQDAVPVQLKSGSGVFFNGYLLHRSLPNTTKNNFRRALATHYMSAESLLPWDMDGRIPPTQDNRDILMVTGKDPYHWKPLVTNLSYPYIRADSSVGTVYFNEKK
jgi:phytanoyl-CoA hydroxylase